MKRTIVFILSLLAVLLAGCESPLGEKPAARGGGASLALIRLAAFPQARTALPALDSLSYFFAFTSGGTTLYRNSSAPPLEIELAPGNWAVAVEGYASSDEDSPVVVGNAAFTVAEAQKTEVTVELYPGAEALALGQGTLSYRVGFPPGLKQAKLEAIPLGGAPESYGRTVDLLEGLAPEAAERAGELGLHAGYYRLVLSLRLDDGGTIKTAARVEAGHVYHEQITAFTPSFSVEDFIPGAIFTDLAAMKAHLEGLPANTKDTPYLVSLQGLDVSAWGEAGNPLGALVDSLGDRYVDLDLSGCIGTAIGDQSSAFPSLAQRNFLVALALPDTIETIGSYFLYNYVNLKSVVMPAGLKSLGDYGFTRETGAAGTGIETIDLSRTALVSLGARSFTGCPHLREVKFPATLTDVGYYGFAGCDQLERIVQETPLTSIGLEAFLGCSKLESLMISADAEITISGGFAGCSSLSFDVRGAGAWSAGGANNALLLSDNGKTLALWPSAAGAVAVPGGIEKIGRSCFENNAVITSVTLGTGLKEIGYQAFFGSGLTSLTLGGAVETIGQFAFYDCRELLTATIAAPNLTVIPANAFARCTKLTAADLSGSPITTIGDAAFRDCWALASVSLPNTLTDLATILSDNTNNAAFTNCPVLASFTVAPGGSTPYSAGLDGKALLKTEGSDLILLFYPTAAGAVVIPQGITKISAFAFRQASKFTEDYYAISGNNAITSVTFPSSLTGLEPFSGIGVFELCRNLAAVDMSAATALTAIGEEAFSYCDTLASVIFPPQLQSIGARSFIYCPLLAAIDLPATLLSIGDSAFVSDGGKGLATLAIRAEMPPTLGAGALPAPRYQPFPDFMPDYWYGAPWEHIYVPAGKEAAYKAAPGWSDLAAYIETMPNI
jgi:hypothetical protein